MAESKPRNMRMTLKTDTSWIRRKYDVLTEGKQTPVDEEPLDKQMPSRLVDFFLVVGRGDLKKEYQKVELSYGLFDVQFDPAFVDRYPADDYPDCALSPQVGLFMFPEGIELRPTPDKPKFSAFVLTDADGVKQYGANLIFWEKLSDSQLSEVTDKLKGPGANQEGGTHYDEAYSPKCITILSHWAFIRPFIKLLRVLYRITMTADAPLPVERYIAHFMHEVPVPPAGRIQVQLNIGDQVVVLQRSPPNKLPSIHVALMTVFRVLSPNNAILLLAAVLTEQKIVLISSLWSVLMDVAETMSALIFPFVFQGVYMPILPEPLIDFIYAPVPFLAGIHSSYLELIELPSELVIVNLEKDTIRAPSLDSIPGLPSKDVNKLVGKIKQHAPYRPPQNGGLSRVFSGTPNQNIAPLSDYAFTGGCSPVKSFYCKSDGIADAIKNDSFEFEPDQKDVEELQNAFLRFFASIFRNYSDYFCDEPREDPEKKFEYSWEKHFDWDGFIEDSPEGNRAFLLQMRHTQMFSQFIHDRLDARSQFQSATSEAAEMKSPVSDNGDKLEKTMNDLMFFDEVIIAKKNRSKRNPTQETPFLDDTSNEIEKTFVPSAPNLSALPQDTFTYDSFPKLSKELFGRPRPTKHLIDGELMSRRSRVSHLTRRTIQCREEMYNEIDKLWPKDFHAVITIDNTSSVDEITYYHVKIKTKDFEKTVIRRYNQFKEFDMGWRDSNPDVAYTLPKAKLRSTRPKVIEERKTLLRNYLQGLATVLELQPQLAAFLEVEHHVLDAPTLTTIPKPLQNKSYMDSLKSGLTTVSNSIQTSIDSLKKKPSHRISRSDTRFPVIKEEKLLIRSQTSLRPPPNVKRNRRSNSADESIFAKTRVAKPSFLLDLFSKPKQEEPKLVKNEATNAIQHELRSRLQTVSEFMVDQEPELVDSLENPVDSQMPNSSSTTSSSTNSVAKSATNSITKSATNSATELATTSATNSATNSATISTSNSTNLQSPVSSNGLTSWGKPRGPSRYSALTLVDTGPHKRRASSSLQPARTAPLPTPTTPKSLRAGRYPAVKRRIDTNSTSSGSLPIVKKPPTPSRTGTPPTSRRAGTPPTSRRAGTPPTSRRAGTQPTSRRAGAPQTTSRAGTPPTGHQGPPPGPQGPPPGSQGPLPGPQGPPPGPQGPPSRRVGTSPNEHQGPLPSRRSGTPPNKRTGTPPNKRTGVPPNKRAGAPPNRRTGTPPVRRLGSPPGRARPVSPVTSPSLKNRVGSRIPPRRLGPRQRLPPRPRTLTAAPRPQNVTPRPLTMPLHSRLRSQSVMSKTAYDRSTDIPRRVPKPPAHPKRTSKQQNTADECRTTDEGGGTTDDGGEEDELPDRKHGRSLSSPEFMMTARDIVKKFESMDIVEDCK